MCQFNLIFVKNEKNKNILKNNQYNCFGDNFNNFSPYVKGFCNCNSFVGSMCEYDGNSFFEMIESSNKSELQNLNEIKDFMNKPNYIKLRQNYINTRDSLSNVLEKFFEPLSNYEMEQISILERKYKGRELEKQIEFLYKDLDAKLNKIENSPEFKSAEKKLNTFINNNKLMEESTFYYLTIDDVIKNLNNKYETAYNNFLEYKQLFEKLLENEAYILFSCIWNEPEKMSVEKEVNIKDIKIEDLASLKFNQILKIYK